MIYIASPYSYIHYIFSIDKMSSVLNCSFSFRSISLENRILLKICLPSFSVIFTLEMGYVPLRENSSGSGVLNLVGSVTFIIDLFLDRQIYEITGEQGRLSSGRTT